MYMFKITDNEAPINKTKEFNNEIHSSSPITTNIEFAEVVKQEEGYNKTKFKKIYKPKSQTLGAKPRNTFIIFRSLVKSIITEHVPDASFSKISKISASMWKKRNKNLENYVKYLAKQDEIYKDQQATIFKQEEKIRKEKVQNKKLAEVKSTKQNIFKYYKNKQEKLPKQITETFRPKNRIEDIYINFDNQES